MSDKVQDYFSNLQELHHPGGHGIPMKAAQKKVFIKFFQECASLCLSKESEGVTG